MLEFFHQFLYIPIYNLLIYLVGVLPAGDVGLAVVIVTLIVKAITFPFSIAALRTQQAMKKIEPLLTEIKETHKDDKEAQAKAMFALYKEHGIRPFASFIAMLIQIPVLISLYLVFSRESMAVANLDILYTFVPDPGTFSALFLGFFVIAGHNIILAVLAAATQFVQAYYAIPVPPKALTADATPTAQVMGAEFGRAMAVQARYVLPLIIGVVAYTSGAIALYFITSNLVGIAQEFYIRKTKKSS